MSIPDKRTEMLRNGTIKKTLLTLAIPSIIGMVVNGIYNIVDTIFVGRIGTSAVGAVAVVFPFFMLISSLGIAIGMGSASYISRSLGRDNKKEAENTAITGILLVVGIGIALMFLGLHYLEDILRLFGATESILSYGLDYGRVLVIGSPFVMLKMFFNNVMRAEGSVKASMVALLLGAVLNIVLDPIFIFTFDMGIRGAAVATIISQAISVVFQVWYYQSRRSYLQLRLKGYRPNRVIISQIFIIGLPLFFTQGLNSGAMALVNNAASDFGDAAVAAMGIVKRVMSLGLFALFGYSQAFLPVAGFNYGAKRYDRLWEAIRFSIKLSTIFTIVISVFIIGLSEQVMSWFSDDPEVLAIGARALRAYSIPFPMLGFQLIYFSLFQALGRGVPAGLLSVSRQGLILIPAVLFLPLWIGLDGVILAQPVADGLTILMTGFLAIRINKEIKNNIVAHKEMAAVE
ncbi:putative MATE family efflux protein [Natronobacillus azotifigens]|uniref:Multidrug export protein MepA n=1 Tax=Natronobacillus azotifigens TaxID=472978 RepID=A0A9J6RCY1_9BACI|nr:MATE family efflux transporter [Natronobacillus azotifigens]MCZ0703073.1 MATE family efflux transporter [Natronobacillus azotifigens]